MAATAAVTSIELESLPKVASGKVRDLFAIDDKTLLFVASDRISAFDVVMANGVPGKGVLLTQLSAHFFRMLAAKVPGLQHHLISLAPPVGLSPADEALVRGRSMTVRRVRVFPIEAIV